MLVTRTGVTHHEPERATPGFTLFSRTQTDQVYLVDMDGEPVRRWTTGGGSTHFACLLPNGNLWVCERAENHPDIVAGPGGRIREYDWDGGVVWEHDDRMQHHDARRLADGGAAYLAWELLDDETARRIGGGIPGTEHADGIFGEVVREVDAEGNVVWEWRITDLDVERHPLHRNAPRAIYGHANALDVLPGGDYLVSFKTLNLLAILDRRTGKVAWEFQDDEMGGQHDAQMLANGNVLVFANGVYGSDIQFSSVWEIAPSSRDVVWKYVAKRNAVSFYSPHISGCQRLWSGNTLICEGGKGAIFEVTPERDVVWEYVCPYWGRHPKLGEINYMFRARRYAADSPEIRNRIPTPASRGERCPSA